MKIRSWSETGLRGALREAADRTRFRYRSLTRNSASRRLFRSNPARLGQAQAQIVEGLRRQGLASMPFDELVDDPGCWPELAETVAAFVGSAPTTDRIQAYQQDFRQAGWKEYLVRRFPPGSTVACSHPLVRFGVSRWLLEIANAYLDLWSKLLYFDIWYTIPLNVQREKVASQRWHRDPDDERILKVFLYFSDVDESAGPLEYIRGSNAAGKYYGHFRRRGQHYPSESELERLVSPSDRAVCTGPRGTFVFCDTRGFHRGGYATEHPRILAKWVFVSPASISPRAYRLEWEQEAESWGPVARFAVT